MKKLEPAVKTVTLFSDGASDEQKLLWDKAKRLFEAKQPGVTIAYTYFNSGGNAFSSAAYRKGIEDLIQKGEPPDLVAGNPAFFTGTESQRQGFFSDLGFIAKGSGVSLTDYFDRSLLNSFSQGSKLLALPTAVSPMIVMYNKSVFQKAGLAEPKLDWTWEELAEAAERIGHLDGGQQSKTVFPVQLGTMSTLFLGNGGSVVSPDGTVFTGYLDGKPTVEAIEWYAKQVKQGLFDTVQDKNTLKQLENGEVGLFVTHYSQTFLLSPANRERVGVAVASSFSKKDRAVLGNFAGIGILQKSRNPELAWDFMKYVMMDDNEISEEFLHKFGFGVSKKVTPSIERDPFYSVLLSSIPYLRKDAHQANADILNVQTALRKNLEWIVMNSSDYQKSLSDLAQFMDDEFKKSGLAGK
ncbi:ABC transporter substrate-binding protein [Paenibacillus sp. GYB003]|uniref:ABC transporter substrate-binding protein n=1 Tax=Paenibacillus sp. GYB003 TaxID=2994392 RepID=UPI002F96C320